MPKIFKTETESRSSAQLSSMVNVSKFFYLSSSVIMKLTALFCIYSVIFEYSIISVNAIRCYQCNSNNNESCLSSVGEPNSNIFLDECKISDDGKIPFCRKIALTVQYKNDYRIIRSCGYTPYKNRTDRCLTADNEGYLEQICQCFTEGCNAASTIKSSYNYYQNLSISLGILIIIGLFTNHFHCV